jgi:hypothetical protein
LRFSKLGTLHVTAIKRDILIVNGYVIDVSKKGMLREIVLVPSPLLMMSSRETNKRSDAWGVVWM